MASSSNKVIASPVKTALETQVRPQGGPAGNLLWADLALRLVLLSSSAAALAITLTSNQTKLISNPLLAAPIAVDAKFKYSSAIVYAMGINSAVCLHSILSAASAFVLAKPSPSARLLLLLAFLDTLMAALMASGAGAVSSVAYIALKGNSHVGWRKVCNVFDKFCRHVGSSIALDLASVAVLIVLVLISTYSLYRRSSR